MVRQIFLVIIFFSISECGFEKKCNGARGASMGGAMTAESGDIWSIAQNPAGTSSLLRFQTGVSYTPQKFGFWEVNSAEAVACLPSRAGVFGCMLQSSGFELYRETAATFSYSGRLSDLSFGLNLNYYHVSIKNYGSAGTAGLDVGCLVFLSGRFGCGLFFRNINSPTLGTAREKLPQSIALGINSEPFDYLKILADIYKEPPFPPSLRAGVEYWCNDFFSIRGGMNEYPAQYSGGFGLRHSVCQVDFAATRHMELGWGYTVSVSFF